ncbi:MAG: threonine synthase [Lysobacteraceae bacterium]
MNCISTRGESPAIRLHQALITGLAPDGGLYVPETLPTIDAKTIGALREQPLATVAEAVLSPYVADSPLQASLASICEQAFDFPAPFRALRDEHDHLLELFHGPTAAFKDYAARFLAGCLSALRSDDAPVTTILVATSGDTGAAVAAAFHRRPGFRVVILYPDGRVSPVQAHGLGCWGDNVQAFRVDGSFDDCQRLAKQALADTELRQQSPLTTANSISLGRLLPQAAYYAKAAIDHQARHGDVLNVIVPTGNLGNACAALVARRMGFPVGELRLATNANPTLSEFFAGDDYRPRDAIATLANAMDVGAPSNFERLRHWHEGDDDLRKRIRVHRIDDQRIRNLIRETPERHGIIPCPHTATGLAALQDIRNTGDNRHWAVAATAHPAKFPEIVEPLVGQSVKAPAALRAQAKQPANASALGADYGLLRNVLLAGSSAP